MTIFENDRALLTAFRQGDREALRRVYMRFFEELRRFLASGFTLAGPPPLHVAGMQSESERLDALQEVFVRAFDERARLAYDGLRPYRPYLLRIARNWRIDQLRLQRKLPSMPLDEQLELAVDEPPPEQALHDQALSDATREFIAALDAEAQRFVELRFVQELSQAEVAAQMAVTRRRIRTLEANVQSDLKRFLRQRGLR